MLGVGLISLDQLDKLITQRPNYKNGCLLDTNILISASITIDPANDAAELLLQELARLEVPVYSNVNIRTEFLEIQRRILIPECLIEFYESRNDHDDEVVQLCNLNFVKIRDGEGHPLLVTKVSWDGVTDIMGTYGTSSADAMISNLLLSSKIELVATGDSDIKYLSDFFEVKGKTVLEIKVFKS